ncbi:hypothetical protein HG530_012531 [Fusarium avenaceum]|nr:hypothetical protein HG530_012531 [Fusarium avenaceum]
MQPIPTQLNHLIIKGRDLLLQTRQAFYQPTMAFEASICIPTGSSHAELVADLVAVQDTASGLNEPIRDVHRMQILEGLDEVITNDDRSWRHKKLVRDVILNFLWVGCDSHDWELQPCMIAAERGNSVDRIQGIDGNAMRILVEESALRCSHFENLLSHHGVQQTHPHNGDMPFPTRLNVPKGVGHLEDHLERLQETSAQYAGAETPGTSEYFYHTGRSRILSHKALKSKPNEIC